jgi:hypothetical protein
MSGHLGGIGFQNANTLPFHDVCGFDDNADVHACETCTICGVRNADCPGHRKQISLRNVASWIRPNDLKAVQQLLVTICDGCGCFLGDTKCTVDGTSKGFASAASAHIFERRREDDIIIDAALACLLHGRNRDAFLECVRTTGPVRNISKMLNKSEVLSLGQLSWVKLLEITCTCENSKTTSPHECIAGHTFLEILNTNAESSNWVVLAKELQAWIRDIGTFGNTCESKSINGFSTRTVDIVEKCELGMDRLENFMLEYGTNVKDACCLDTQRQILLPLFDVVDTCLHQIMLPSASELDKQTVKKVDILRMRLLRQRARTVGGFRELRGVIRRREEIMKQETLRSMSVLASCVGSARQSSSGPNCEKVQTRFEQTCVYTNEMINGLHTLRQHRTKLDSIEREVVAPTVLMLQHTDERLTAIVEIVRVTTRLGESILSFMNLAQRRMMKFEECALQNKRRCEIGARVGEIVTNLKNQPELSFSFLSEWRRCFEEAELCKILTMKMVQRFLKSCFVLNEWCAIAAQGLMKNCSCLGLAVASMPDINDTFKTLDWHNSLIKPQPNEKSSWGECLPNVAPSNSLSGSHNQEDMEAWVDDTISSMMDDKKKLDGCIRKITQLCVSVLRDSSTETCPTCTKCNLSDKEKARTNQIQRDSFLHSVKNCLFHVTSCHTSSFAAVDLLNLHATNIENMKVSSLDSSSSESLVQIETSVPTRQDPPLYENVPKSIRFRSDRLSNTCSALRNDSVLQCGIFAGGCGRMQGRFTTPRDQREMDVLRFNSYNIHARQAVPDAMNGNLENVCNEVKTLSPCHMKKSWKENWWPNRLLSTLMSTKHTMLVVATKRADKEAKAKNIIDNAPRTLVQMKSCGVTALEAYIRCNSMTLSENVLTFLNTIMFKGVQDTEIVTNFLIDKPSERRTFSAKQTRGLIDSLFQSSWITNQQRQQKSGDVKQCGVLSPETPTPDDGEPSPPRDQCNTVRGVVWDDILDSGEDSESEQAPDMDDRSYIVPAPSDDYLDDADHSSLTKVLSNIEGDEMVLDSDIVVPGGDSKFSNSWDGLDKQLPERIATGCEDVGGALSTFCGWLHGVRQGLLNLMKSTKTRKHASSIQAIAVYATMMPGVDLYLGVKDVGTGSLLNLLYNTVVGEDDKEVNAITYRLSFKMRQAQMFVHRSVQQAIIGADNNYQQSQISPLSMYFHALPGKKRYTIRGSLTGNAAGNAIRSVVTSLDQKDEHVSLTADSVKNILIEWAVTNTNIGRARRRILLHGICQALLKTYDVRSGVSKKPTNTVVRVFTKDPNGVGDARWYNVPGSNEFLATTRQGSFRRKVAGGDDVQSVVKLQPKVWNELLNIVKTLKPGDKLLVTPFTGSVASYTRPPILRSTNIMTLLTTLEDPACDLADWILTCWLQPIAVEAPMDSERVMPSHTPSDGGGGESTTTLIDESLASSTLDVHSLSKRFIVTEAIAERLKLWNMHANLYKPTNTIRTAVPHCSSTNTDFDGDTASLNFPIRSEQQLGAVLTATPTTMCRSNQRASCLAGAVACSTTMSHLASQPTYHMRAWEVSELLGVLTVTHGLTFSQVREWLVESTNKQSHEWTLGDIFNHFLPRSFSSRSMTNGGDGLLKRTDTTGSKPQTLTFTRPIIGQDVKGSQARGLITEVGQAFPADVLGVLSDLQMILTSLVHFRPIFCGLQDQVLVCNMPAPLKQVLPNLKRGSMFQHSMSRHRPNSVAGKVWLEAFAGSTKVQNVANGVEQLSLSRHLYQTWVHSEVQKMEKVERDDYHQVCGVTIRNFWLDCQIEPPKGDDTDRGFENVRPVGRSLDFVEQTRYHAILRDLYKRRRQLVVSQLQRRSKGTTEILDQILHDQNKCMENGCTVHGKGCELSGCQVRWIKAATTRSLLLVLCSGAHGSTDTLRKTNIALLDLLDVHDILPSEIVGVDAKYCNGVKTVEPSGFHIKRGDITGSRVLCTQTPFVGPTSNVPWHLVLPPLQNLGVTTQSYTQGLGTDTMYLDMIGSVVNVIASATNVYLTGTLNEQLIVGCMSDTATGFGLIRNNQEKILTFTHPGDDGRSTIREWSPRHDEVSGAIHDLSEPSHPLWSQNFPDIATLSGSHHLISARDVDHLVWNKVHSIVTNGDIDRLEAITHHETPKVDVNNRVLDHMSNLAEWRTTWLVHELRCRQIVVAAETSKGLVCPFDVAHLVCVAKGVLRGGKEEDYYISKFHQLGQRHVPEPGNGGTHQRDEDTPLSPTYSQCLSARFACLHTMLTLIEMVDRRGPGSRQPIESDAVLNMMQNSLGTNHAECGERVASHFWNNLFTADVEHAPVRHSYIHRHWFLLSRIVTELDPLLTPIDIYNTHTSGCDFLYAEMLTTVLVKFISTRSPLGAPVGYEAATATQEAGTQAQLNTRHTSRFGCVDGMLALLNGTRKAAMQAITVFPAKNTTAVQLAEILRPRLVKDVVDATFEIDEYHTFYPVICSNHTTVQVSCGGGNYTNRYQTVHIDTRMGGDCGVGRDVCPGVMKLPPWALLSKKAAVTVLSEHRCRQAGRPMAHLVQQVLKSLSDAWFVNAVWDAGHYDQQNSKGGRLFIIARHIHIVDVHHGVLSPDYTLSDTHLLEWKRQGCGNLLIWLQLQASVFMWNESASTIRGVASKKRKHKSAQTPEWCTIRNDSLVCIDQAISKRHKLAQEMFQMRRSEKVSLGMNSDLSAQGQNTKHCVLDGDQRSDSSTEFDHPFLEDLVNSEYAADKNFANRLNEAIQSRCGRNMTDRSRTMHNLYSQQTCEIIDGLKKGGVEAHLCAMEHMGVRKHRRKQQLDNESQGIQQTRLESLSTKNVLGTALTDGSLTAQCILLENLGNVVNSGTKASQWHQHDLKTQWTSMQHLIANNVLSSEDGVGEIKCYDRMLDNTLLASKIANTSLPVRSRESGWSLNDSACVENNTQKNTTCATKVGDVASRKRTQKIKPKNWTRKTTRKVNVEASQPLKRATHPLTDFECVAEMMASSCADKTIVSHASTDVENKKVLLFLQTGASLNHVAELLQHKFIDRMQTIRFDDVVLAEALFGPEFARDQYNAYTVELCTQMGNLLPRHFQHLANHFWFHDPRSTKMTELPITQSATSVFSGSYYQSFQKLQQSLHSIRPQPEENGSSAINPIERLMCGMH